MMYRWFVIAIFILGACPGLARDATMAYLNWNPDAYTTGLSAGSVTAGRTVSSLESNPAFIADWRQWRVGGTFSQPIPLFTNIAHTFGGIAFPFSEKINVALSGHQYWLGRQGHASEYGSSVEGGFDTDAIKGRLSVGMTLNNSLDVGLSQSGLWYDIDGYFAPEVENSDESRNAFYTDIGAVWKGSPVTHYPAGIQVIDAWASQVPRHRWKIGLALQNIFGQQMSFIDADQADPLPRNVLIGGQLLLYKTALTEGMIAVDVESQLTSKNSIDRVGAGVELRILQIGVLTTGFTWRAGKYTPNYSSGGVGIETRVGSIYFSQKATPFKPVYAWEGGLRWIW